MFKYDDLINIDLPNYMSVDKAVIRTTIIPSLLKIYEYNKARKVNDILLYEISKVYDKDYNEDTKISILMKGSYLTNNWQNQTTKIDFYVVKGIVENLLDYLGLKNRYSFEKDLINDLHPGMSAKIMIDRQPAGIIGRVHPSTHKDEIYVVELSLKALIKNIKPIKFKEASKYPTVTKDMAFIINKKAPSSDILEIIKRVGSRLLTDVDVFDVYVGENVGNDEKSIAYTLTFSDPTRTLSDDEVNELFKRIISEVESKTGAKLRDK